MADTDTTITIGIELDDGTIKKAVVDVAELGQKLGNDFGKKVSDGIDKSFTGIAVQLQFVAKLASRAFDAVAGTINSAIDEAVQAEQALARFNGTLANMGKLTAGASEDFQSFAKSLQQVGTVSDDAVIEAATSLVSIGKLSGQALKEASQASVNLAAGLGTDLGSAFDLVAKAAAGNTSALGRYGIKIDESIPKSERFAAVLQTLNDRFGGLDQQKANTFGGALTQLSNNFSDLQENIGKIITSSPAVVAVIKFISDSFKSFAGSVDSFGKSGGDVLKPFVIQLIEIGRTINTFVIGPIEKLGQIGVFVFNAIETGLQTILAGIGQLAGGLGTVLGAVGFISDDTQAKLTSFAESSAETLVAFAEVTSASGLAIKDALTITPQVDTMLVDLQRVVDTAAPITEALKNNFKATSDGIVSSLALTSKQLATIVNNAMVNIISQSIQGLINNLVRGKNAFEGFIKTIGGLMGDMLITIGTTTLLAGIGMEAIRSSVVGLTGGPAIFAGIALIAAGALLKALSGGGGGSEQPTQTTGTAPGGGAAPPDTVGSITEQPEADRARKTEVAINIQGNVLDRKETGIEIANVLQEFFDTQDGVLARA